MAFFRTSASARKWLWLVVFFVIPLVVADTVARFAHRNLFQRFEARIAQTKIDVVLLGSSRVAAAFREDVLAGHWSAQFRSRPPIQVANLGRGYSRPHDKVVAFRRWFEKFPESLKGTHFFIETLRGMPDVARWSDAWAVDQALGLLTPYVTWRDLVQMGQSSATSPLVVFQLGLFHVLPGTLLLKKVRDYFDVTFQTWEPRQDTHGAHRPQLGKAGILPNPQGKILRALEKQADPHVPPIRELKDEWVWTEFVRMVLAHGGKVHFFEVPSSSQDPVMRASSGFVRTWKWENMTFDVLPWSQPFADTDFPDHLHLVPEKMETASHLLAEAFLKAKPDAF